MMMMQGAIAPNNTACQLVVGPALLGVKRRRARVEQDVRVSLNREALDRSRTAAARQQTSAGPQLERQGPQAVR